MSDEQTREYLKGEQQKLEREIANKLSVLSQIERQLDDYAVQRNALDSKIEMLRGKYNGDSNHDSRIKSDIEVEHNKRRQIESIMNRTHDRGKSLTQEIKRLKAKLSEIITAISKGVSVA
ncbi:MAG: hypothetical protein K0U45_03155 [Alphaproteobacteria bacterium]|nr:hypothetical protein [Alphaproteobacteria bacterium]